MCCGQFQSKEATISTTNTRSIFVQVLGVLSNSPSWPSVGSSRASSHAGVPHDLEAGALRIIHQEQGRCGRSPPLPGCPSKEADRCRAGRRTTRVCGSSTRKNPFGSATMLHVRPASFADGGQVEAVPFRDERLLHRRPSGVRALTVPGRETPRAAVVVTFAPPRRQV